MKWLKTIAGAFSAPRIGSREDVRDFLESRSAYLVQKSITEYTQARANMMFSTLLGEKAFRDAYERARWHAFPAGMAMVGETVMARLRIEPERHPAPVAAFLTPLMGEIVSAFPLPPEAEGGFWEAALSAAEADLARAALAEPRPAFAIARDRAREVFDALPVHATVKKHDFDMFRNTLSFHLTEIATELSEIRPTRIEGLDPA